MTTNTIKLGKGTWDAALRLPAQIPVNVGNINRETKEADCNANTQGEITAYQAILTTNGFEPTNMGSVTEPAAPTPTTPPTADEITRDAEIVTAFNNVMENEINRIKALVETEYELIKTTTEAFSMKFDIKHLRQRAR